MLTYLRILAEQPRPIRFLLSRILWRTGLCRRLQIRKPGYRLRFYPSALSATLWINPDQWHDDEAFLRSYLRPGDVIIDVGANIGDLTLAASTIVGETGRVYAVEPHPTIYEFLVGNVALNQRKNVESFNTALGESHGAVRFSSQRADDQNGVVSGESGIEVPVSPLDDLPLGDGTIALLKVDVEGYEKFVFSGAIRTLARVRCVYFESWDHHFEKFGYQTGDLLKLLQDAGFEVFRRTDGSLSTVASDYHSEQCENLIALRDPGEFAERTRMEDGGRGTEDSGSVRERERERVGEWESERVGE